MPALYLVLVSALVAIIAYRTYGAFLAAKVATLDDLRATPAHTLKDGRDYVPTHPLVLFGHHFAAIAGAGPLIGPVLAAQFGYLPGFLWLLVGSVLAGGVHDFVILTASVRSQGRSLANIAREQVSPLTGTATALAIVFVMMVALAAMALVVVNSLKESAWGVFSIGCTIPIALAMGLWSYRFRPGSIRLATAFGVVLLLVAVGAGAWVQGSPVRHWFIHPDKTIGLGIMVYGFIASVLPVWLLLCPRDYLSSFMKIGAVALLAVGVILVNPRLQMPALTPFIHGGGPVFPGPLFPYVFITIACGAISGFHSLIASGTTPKMIDRERHILPISYGAMVLEGFVGVIALIAACALHPADYFAINSKPEVFAGLGMAVQNLHGLEAQVGEKLAGRPGGAVSLAVGMAQIFSSLPRLRGLMSFWYFAIMFEAMFVLTLIDTGTRVTRYMLQEVGGMAFPPLREWRGLAPSLLFSALAVGAWGYFLWTGTVSTIWPMLGVSNQLLAAFALAIGTSVLINMGKARYAWCTVLPLAFMCVNTLTAGWMNIGVNYLRPQLKAGAPGLWQAFLAAPTPARIQCIVTLGVMVLLVVVVLDSLFRWGPMLRRRRVAAGEAAPGAVPEPAGL
ncbi:MAG: carbon starvation protein A [Candidatus Eisenbacteria bacterium]|uniref:Carbon starvation protein A n=1 Tax=Eiseniibacteriota bacterium TaxID=2212470 RepID=A0A538SDL2_UNCEI|nr:MAG: carbon starvation protein A [Candidatus Eisenbacteria bacterium]